VFIYYKKISASSWLILINKYIEMHGQQNIKKQFYVCVRLPLCNRIAVDGYVPLTYYVFE